MKYKQLLLALSGIILGGSIAAQKLPGIQQKNFRAPADVKINGRATEWNDKFQAYNNATDLFYTVANDDEMLYLIVQAKYHDVIDKIMRGGITFSISPTAKKNDLATISVTYPVLRDANVSLVTNMLARKMMTQRDENGNIKPVETTVNDLNQLMDAKSKLINVAGFKTITDEAISVYNNDGIKAAAQFDSHVVYTYELAVPLKYLALPKGGKEVFAYHIKVNEPAAMRVLSGGPPPPPMLMTATVVTDFWGEYSLAK